MAQVRQWERGVVSVTNNLETEELRLLVGRGGPVDSGGGE